MLRFMGLQRVGHDWATDLMWSDDFSTSHLWMWELDYKESWALKNWCFWTVVLEKTLESSLYARSSNQSMLKEISPEYSVEGLMLKLKLQYFGHLMQRADSLEKTLTLGDWRQKQKRGTEDEIVGWHHRVNGYELGQILGYGEGQGGLACYSTWGHKESDMAWWLNNNNIVQSWISIVSNIIQS